MPDADSADGTPVLLHTAVVLPSSGQIAGWRNVLDEPFYPREKFLTWQHGPLIHSHVYSARPSPVLKQESEALERTVHLYTS